MLRAVAKTDSSMHVDSTKEARSNDRGSRHTLFHAVWLAANVLLLLSILATAYSVVWEYSTRRYLRGFSDAIVPAAGGPEEKIEAILHWMANGPARRDAPPDGSLRDPTETLNYASLLKVCGSATNAFLNLADSAGLSSRRLLLLDSRRLTVHVVAEVLVDGRWIVVDPAFRTILRDSSGGMLTRQQLADTATFAVATAGISGYDPSYTYTRTVHVRLSRIGPAGPMLRTLFNHVAPGWEDSMTTSLLLERESLATLTIAILMVMLLALIRVFLRWYGAHRWGIHPLQMRARVYRAVNAFLDPGTTP
ncbi:MAG TPA: transglutaminase domain-containing protein [Candidatus Aquilonibacter sp.]|nr:transglutaminase domain-containing protein [Candidatus Aquilonibacter sp.]